MTVFVVRHAKAGDRDTWTRPDADRPLTKSGVRQAEALVGLLSSEEIQRIVSSAHVRCVQTVEPLAKARGMKIEMHDALAEGAPLEDALALLREATRSNSVLCTHGDVLDDLLSHLTVEGVAGVDPSKGQKGSTWVLETRDDEITRARYLAPPA